MKPCAFPQCQDLSPSADSVFCVDHHFACTPVEARLLIGTAVSARRAETAEERAHLGEQLAAYTKTVVASIQKRQGANSVA